MATVEDRVAAGVLSQGSGDGVLLNPRTYDGAELDATGRGLMAATIEWFESRGKVALKDADRDNVWYSDYLEFQAREGIFAPLPDAGVETAAAIPSGAGTPSGSASFSEVSAFYGLAYWYTWQVTILGLGPIFQ